MRAHPSAQDISKAGIRAVMESLNDHADRPIPNLAAACHKWWPDLEPKCLERRQRPDQRLACEKTERYSKKSSPASGASVSGPGWQIKP